MASFDVFDELHQKHGSSETLSQATMWAKMINGGYVINDGTIVYGRKPAGTINLTPTWRGVLPLLLETYAHGTDKGRAMALAELQNMAKLADERNASLPK